MNLRRSTAQMVTAAAFIACGFVEAGAQQPATPAPPPVEAKAPEPKVGPLTALNLIVAMPTDVESIWIQDVEKINQDERLAKLLTEPAGGPPPDDSLTDANTALLAGIAKAKPLLHALGGSNFTRPKDLGAGGFKRREIWVVRQSLATLKRELTNPDTKCFVRVERDGPESVYRGRYLKKEYGREAPKEETICFGFSADNAIVIADTVADAAHLLDALKAPSCDVPKKWSELVDDQTLSAASFVIREYDPSRPNEFWQIARPNTGDVPGAHRLRLIVKDVRSLPTVRCWTSDIEKTKEMLTYTMGHPSFLEADGGITATGIRREGEDDPAVSVLLIPMVVFGQVVFI
jgi:hypothetical protein